MHILTLYITLGSKEHKFCHFYLFSTLSIMMIGNFRFFFNSIHAFDSIYM